MQQRMITALAEVLNVNLNDYKDLSQSEILALLEEKQLAAVLAI